MLRGGARKRQTFLPTPPFHNNNIPTFVPNRLYSTIKMSSPSDSAHRNSIFRRREGKRHAWTEIESIGEGRFCLKLPDILRHGWMYGGDFAAQSLHCAYQTVPEDMRIQSFHSYFISPGQAKPLDFMVERLRDGEKRAWRRVEVKQDGKVVYHAEFMFKKAGSKEYPKMTKEEEFPQVPRPEELRTSFEIFEQLKKEQFDLKQLHRVAFWDDMPHIEHKPCNQAEFLYGPDKPSLSQSLWLRYGLENFSNHPRFNDLITVYLTDMGICFAGTMPFPRRQFRKIASVDLTAWIHLHDGIQPNEHFLFQTRCMSHHADTALNLGKLWAKDGKLVATVMQESVSAPKPLEDESKL